MRNGFVYIWRDRKRKMFYIGCHWGPEDDGYICSSNRMRDAYRRRPQDFKRRILLRIATTSYDNLLEQEHKWLNLISDEKLGIKYYNLHKTRNHWINTDKSKSIGEKISKTKIERKVHAGKNHWNYGGHLSEETKKKQSEKLKGRSVWNKGTIGKMKAWNKGKKMTSEYCEKSSLGHKGQVPWNKGLKKNSSIKGKITKNNILI